MNKLNIKNENSLVGMLSNAKLGSNSKIDDSKSKGFKDVFENKTKEAVERKDVKTEEKSTDKKVDKKDKTDLEDVVEELDEEIKPKKYAGIMELLAALLGMEEAELEELDGIGDLVAEISAEIELVDLEGMTEVDMKDILTDIVSELAVMDEGELEGKEKLVNSFDELFTKLDETFDELDEETIKNIENILSGLKLEEKTDDNKEVKPVVIDKEMKVDEESTDEADETEVLMETDTKEVKETKKHTKQDESFKDESDEGDEIDTDFKTDMNISVTKSDNPILDPKVEEMINVSDIDEEDVIKQIFNEVQFTVGKDKSQIVIDLEPESLGRLLMNLEVVKGEMTARIFVDNEKTKEVIETNLMTLQEELEDTGMEIKTFEVFVGSESDFDRESEQFNFFNQEQGQKRKLRVNRKQEETEQISTDYEAGTVSQVDEINIYEGGMDLQA